MMSKENIKHYFITEWIFFSACFFIVGLLIKNDVSASEIWVRNYARAYFVLVGAFAKYIPFSLTEIIVVVLIIMCIYFVSLIIYKIIKKDKLFYSYIKKLILELLVVLSLYQLTAGISYNRERVDLPQYEQEVLDSSYSTICEHFLEDFNYCASRMDFEDSGEIINPYSIRQLNQIIEEDYKRVTSDYFASYTTYAKPMLLSSLIYREFHITGVFFGPTGEANFNFLMTNGERPFTIAHELSHSKGVMREDDAQLTALFVCLQSKNEFVRYSAYIETFYSMLNLMKYLDDSKAYANMYYRLNVKIRENYNFISEYYKKHDLWAEFADWWNNLYLKLEGQKEGTQSYTSKEETENQGTEEKPIIKIRNYSTYQKLYFWYYYSKL